MDFYEKCEEKCTECGFFLYNDNLEHCYKCVNEKCEKHNEKTYSVQ
jgi:hypothetical protein